MRETGNQDEVRASVDRALREHFRPEFLNRIDDIIIFEPLTRPELAQIVDLLSAEVHERLAERNVEFELTEAARAALVDEGYDPEYGARPLRRTVERRVENELARRILAGEFEEGQCITVDYAGDEYTLTAHERHAAPEPVPVAS